MSFPPRVLRPGRAFTLVELLVSMAVLSLMVVMMVGMLDQSSRAWLMGERRVYTDQNARAILDLMQRDLAPAVADKRFQFVQFSGANLDDLLHLRAPAGADPYPNGPHVVPNSQALFFFSPVGEGGTVCAIGYFLTFDDAKKSYRLNRLFLKPDNPFYPDFEAFLTSGPDGNDFTNTATRPVWVEKFANTLSGQSKASVAIFNPADPATATTVLSEGIIGLWIGCGDALGNPVPVAANRAREATKLWFNSAARFEVANQARFPDGSSFRYLAASTLQSHRLPAAVSVGIALIDPRSLAKVTAAPAPAVPSFTGADGLDLPLTLQNYEAAARNGRLGQTRIFSQTMPLVNGTP